jgi:hypothetical protein
MEAAVKSFSTAEHASTVPKSISQRGEGTTCDESDKAGGTTGTDTTNILMDILWMFWGVLSIRYP